MVLEEVDELEREKLLEEKEIRRRKMKKGSRRENKMRWENKIKGGRTGRSRRRNRTGGRT
jgi:hypothetical protein